MGDTTSERVARLASEIFDVPAGQLGPEASPSTIGAWDSVAHLNLILALEDEFGIKFDLEEMEKMQSIGQVSELVRAKQTPVR